jgi:uncharacterized protein (DUF433 family)
MANSIPGVAQASGQRHIREPEESTSVTALLERIPIDPEVCGGRPCIKGTRIWVSLVLDNLADGVAENDLLVEDPQLTHDDVLAAIAYGAEAA